ncbi:hypothetical protein CHLRE_12g546633v5 [Chlamydomonas reinhardtii]|uniref:Uncharacterized protein n=1 Tax=Chlamydomonas reinhardtii TaxID=3055 RepID=A0A2K3D5F2_CHLRE|nr:uncharacterized protein CHLRE_12g546633v5 [Chlamydomonas reinhardtii]PNW75760.1 hypothetical protein CHLRE_12g546633v5 [Chlamydomonas reinhardtii]
MPGARPAVMPCLAADSTPAGGGNAASPFFSPGLQLHLALSTHSLAHGVQDLTTQPQGPSLPTYPVLLVGATTGLPEGEQLSSAGVREVTSAALSVLDTMCRQGNQPQLLQGHSLHSTGHPSCTLAGLAFSRRATSASKAAFTAELMRKSPLAVPLQRGQAVLTVHVPVDTRPIIPGTYTVTVKMVGGPVWGAFRGRTDLVLQAGGYPTTSDPSNLTCAYVVSEQCAKSVGPKGEPQAPAGQGITNHIFACVRGPVWDPQLSHLHCAKFEMPGEEPMQVEVRGAPQAAGTATTAVAGSPAPAAAGVADLGGNTLGVARPAAAMATAADIVDHVGDVQMQEAAGLGDAAAAAGGASGPPAVASPSLLALMAGGSTRAAAAPLRAERQQQPSSQQRVAAGGLSGGQPSAGVGGPPAARRRTADAGPAGVQQQPSGAPVPQLPFDQRAAASEAEYGAVSLTRDTCVAIGSDLVTHQNRCADVQGFEWAQLGHDTLGGRLLAYLRDQGATVPDWAVCRVPAGRTAVLAQLHDEFTGWWRLYSAQPADTPLPSDVTEQLDDTAQQVQTAYMDYVLLDARTLRSSKRGPADPGGASGPSRRQRQHRSRSTSSLMSLGSAPLRPGGASSGAASMSTSSGGAPPSQGGGRRGKRHISNSNRNRHGAAVAGGGS